MVDWSAKTVRGVLAVLAGLALTIPAGAGHAASKAREARDLVATSAAPAARGKAKVSLSRKRGKFGIKATRLRGSGHFSLLVNGIKVGSFVSSESGKGKLNYNTKPGSRDHLLGFDPRGSSVIVRDDDTGEDVLVTTMSDDDPSEIACCLSKAEGGDDVGSESECEDVSEAECLAAGGTAQAVSSCLPDPCSTTAPVGIEIICCTNDTGDDESEAECEDVVAPSECTASGGTLVAATSCDPNPCAAVAPTNLTACCVPHTSSSGTPEPAECEVISAEACTAAAGTAVSGAATCTPDPCVVP